MKSLIIIELDDKKGSMERSAIIVEAQVAKYLFQKKDLIMVVKMLRICTVILNLQANYFKGSRSFK